MRTIEVRTRSWGIWRLEHVFEDVAQGAYKDARDMLDFNEELRIRYNLPYVGKDRVTLISHGKKVGSWRVDWEQFKDIMSVMRSNHAEPRVGWVNEYKQTQIQRHECTCCTVHTKHTKEMANV